MYPVISHTQRYPYRPSSASPLANKNPNRIVRHYLNHSTPIPLRPRPQPRLCGADFLPHVSGNVATSGTQHGSDNAAVCVGVAGAGEDVGEDGQEGGGGGGRRQA